MALMLFVLMSVEFLRFLAVIPRQSLQAILAPEVVQLFGAGQRILIPYREVKLEIPAKLVE